MGKLRKQALYIKAMTVRICGKRYRGSWQGVFGLLFILFCWFYCTYCMINIIEKYYLNDDVVGAIVTYGYGLLSALTFLALMQAVKSDAGCVYAVSKSTADSFGWKLCEKCQKNRPPRSHHCSRCERCSRKMDHHCIWINNCVGEDNNGIFIRFLCYGWLQAATTGLACLYYYLDWLPVCSTCGQISADIKEVIKIKMFFLTLVVVWLVIFLSGLLVDRGLLLAADMTTIEMMQDRRLLRARMRDPANPGIIKTLNHTFGTSIFLFWFIPCFCESRVKPEHERQPIFWTYEV